jgi:hypothetical protein
MPPEKRMQLRQQWRQMTPEQRHSAVQMRGAPPMRGPPPMRAAPPHHGPR